MDSEMKYRDGLPIEWRVTLFYVTAASVLTLAIIAADYKGSAIVADEIAALKQEIRELKEIPLCVPPS
jgi:hypothetical protein